jgi:hypothetical protein
MGKDRRRRSRSRRSRKVSLIGKMGRGDGNPLEPASGLIRGNEVKGKHRQV